MQDREILGTYLPDQAIEQVYSWITMYKVHLKISRGRKSKLGDYRPPIRHPHHRISINHDLNPYSFLITFVHELAHLLVFNAHKTSVAPHGKEWKLAFKELIDVLIADNIFPEELAGVLKKSMRNAKASSGSDLILTRMLQQYDHAEDQDKTRVEDLDLGTIFSTQNGRSFQKGEKVRTRYKCLNLKNKKVYLFHPLTAVYLD